MLINLDQYFLEKPEPLKSCLLTLRDIILNQDEDIAMTWKYQAPFFTYRKKSFCYFWIDKKTNEPYIGFMDGFKMQNPILEVGDRTRIKIFRVNPNQDLPIELLHELINEAIDLYKKKNS